MVNPLIGVYLNERYYRYRSDSYTENPNLKVDITETQTDRVVNINQSSFRTFTIELSLDSVYDIQVGTSLAGSTTNVGVSRLTDLIDYISASGVSMPLIFVTPYGATFNTVPTGDPDVKAFNPDNPNAGNNGMEFRVTLTLAQVT